MLQAPNSKKHLSAGCPRGCAELNSIGHLCSGDRSLVQRAQSGEHRAFNELVGKYRQRVMKVSFRYTGNLADAEDAVQQTFFRAYRALAHFRGDCAFYSWLHRIAINSAKTVRSLRLRDEGIFDSITLGIDTAQQAPVMKDFDTPEALALTDEICNAVNGAIESLCEEQRTAIVLRELHGLSYADVASSMSSPVGTVRSRVFRAREAIDNKLRRVFDDGLGRMRGPAIPIPRSLPSN
jgi:RNA polymerase sigma-70 factor (ECF subfamily)